MNKLEIKDNLNKMFEEQKEIKKNLDLIKINSKELTAIRQYNYYSRTTLDWLLRVI